jgi:putative nucleotidyltransferase with HDIG domain
MPMIARLQSIYGLVQGLRKSDLEFFLGHFTSSKLIFKTQFILTLADYMLCNIRRTIMKLIFTKDLVPGMLMGKDAKDGNGFLKLLTKGTILNQSQINYLKKWGLSFLCIEDPVEETEGKGVAVSMTKEEFQKIYQQTLNQIANTFQHIKKFKEVPIAEMQELADQKIMLLVETIGALEYLQDIRSHSEHTFQHSLNVAIVAGILGKWCDYKGAKLKNLILAGLLHDIGKLAVPLSILDKPGRLSAEEFKVIKSHPQKGYEMVKADAGVTEDVKMGIWQHHERIDGSGYPRGLAGDEIYAGAKIISIADVYDAMTTDRVYRNKMTPFEALDIVADDMFERLEPDICLTFLDNMRDYLVGSSVKLSNGQKAKVIAFNARDKYFTKPIVCMRNGKLLDLQSAEVCIVGIS